MINVTIEREKFDYFISQDERGDDYFYLSARIKGSETWNGIVTCMPETLQVTLGIIEGMEGDG